MPAGVVAAAVLLAHARDSSGSRSRSAAEWHPAHQCVDPGLHRSVVAALMPATVARWPAASAALPAIVADMSAPASSFHTEHFFARADHLTVRVPRSPGSVTLLCYAVRVLPA